MAQNRRHELPRSPEELFGPQEWDATTCTRDLLPSPPGLTRTQMPSSNLNLSLYFSSPNLSARTELQPTNTSATHTRFPHQPMWSNSCYGNDAEELRSQREAWSEQPDQFDDYPPRSHTPTPTHTHLRHDAHTSTYTAHSSRTTAPSNAYNPFATEQQAQKVHPTEIQKPSIAAPCSGTDTRPLPQHPLSTSPTISSNLISPSLRNPYEKPNQFDELAALLTPAPTSDTESPNSDGTPDSPLSVKRRRYRD
jgi:hypothetical protein